MADEPQQADEQPPQPDDAADVLAEIRDRLGQLPAQVADLVMRSLPEPAAFEQAPTAGQVEQTSPATPLPMTTVAEGYASLPMQASALALSPYLSQGDSSPPQPPDWPTAAPPTVPEMPAFQAPAALLPQVPEALPAAPSSELSPAPYEPAAVLPSSVLPEYPQTSPAAVPEMPPWEAPPAALPVPGGGFQAAAPGGPAPASFPEAMPATAPLGESFPPMPAVDLPSSPPVEAASPLPLEAAPYAQMGETAPPAPAEWLAPAAAELPQIALYPEPGSPTTATALPFPDAGGFALDAPVPFPESSSFTPALPAEWPSPLAAQLPQGGYDDLASLTRTAATTGPGPVLEGLAESLAAFRQPQQTQAFQGGRRGPDLREQQVVWSSSFQAQGVQEGYPMGASPSMDISSTAGAGGASSRRGYGSTQAHLSRYMQPDSDDAVPR